jgi:hypothetical protein
MWSGDGNLTVDSSGPIKPRIAAAILVVPSTSYDLDLKEREI